MTQKSSRTWLGRDVGIIALAFSLAACGRMLATDAYTALEIKQVQVLEEGDCTVPGEPTSAHRSQGVLDIDLPHRTLDENAWPYLLPVAVANNLASVGATPAEEMNNITLTHFTVELSGPSGVWSDACPGTFDTLHFSYRLAPGGTSGAWLEALTAMHSICLRSTALPVVVTASVQAKGRHGGTPIESAPLVYPITVCAGCAQQGYNDPDLVNYTYPDYPRCDALATENVFLGDPCLSPGQDATILCCGMPDGKPLCPAP